ncbi:MAG: hypothetical protein BEN18_00940 [Epulopiscium sp. Nuni2H_MBin001]|nr:MAG: hypothetical protein BEN18_00940 [Epulopiscium sp. Nuni2H_MBin001]
MYLNTMVPYKNFSNLLKEELYVDKSKIIEILNARINTTRKYICVTRPRRFGKSEITNLIGSYYGCIFDTKQIFDNLQIATTKTYITHLSQLPPPKR